MTISIVCKGNILRSQVLHHYLFNLLMSCPNIRIYSCGISQFEYPNESSLVSDIQNILHRRGLEVIVKRTKWNDKSSSTLRKSQIILAADNEIREVIIKRIGIIYNLYLFYEFIGEGYKEFPDTYNYVKNTQDTTRFYDSFDELERIANLSLPRILKLNNGLGNQKGHF